MNGQNAILLGQFGELFPGNIRADRERCQILTFSERAKNMETRKILAILVPALGLILCPPHVGEVAPMSTTFNPMSTDSNSFLTIRETADPLPAPIVTGNSFELCLNSRYSQHSTSTNPLSTQQLSNVLWAAGMAPITGSYRDIYVATETATYLYDPNGHSLSWHSGDVRDLFAFVISYDRELDFDAGVSSMPALLASVSLWESTESPVVSCPRGWTGTKWYFGLGGEVTGLTPELVAHSSVPEGEPGWLPDPSTTGEKSLEVVLANLNYVDSFVQANLTLQQISQILWAGYGCTPHISSGGYPGRAGLTVPSGGPLYFLTETIYLANENGVYRYHNRNPSTDLTTRDHRTEQINSDDVRGSLQSAVSGLPQAPCYVIICLKSSYLCPYKYCEAAYLETSFVASNMLMQASAIGLGCYFKTELTSGEQGSIQTATSIPSSHIPQVVVSIGPTCRVEFEDYARFAEHWRESDSDLPGDLDGDLDVDLADLSLFVDEWLDTCPHDWPLR